MNSLLKAYREYDPSDLRADDEILLEAGEKHPDLFAQYPDAKADYDEILATRKAIKEMYAPGVTDYIKTGAGNLVRSVAGGLAELPEGIAIGAAALNQKVGSLDIPGTGDPGAYQDRLAYRAGQGIRAAGEAIAPEADPDLKDSFLAKDLPEGVGSALSFIAGGGAGRAIVGGAGRKLAVEAGAAALAKAGAKEITEEAALKAAPMALKLAAKAAESVPIAGLGAVTQANGAYKEALSKGADSDTALQAYLASLPIGASEIIPLGNMLRRLDGISGGTFTKALVRAGKETFEESVQEAAQQIAGNAVARELYDKDRELTDGVMRGAAAGGATGFLLSALTSAIGGARGSKSVQSPGLSTSKEASTSLPTPPPLPPGPARGEAPPAAAEMESAVDPAILYRVTDEEKLASIEARLQDSARLFGPMDGRAPTTGEMELLKLRATLTGQPMPVAESDTQSQTGLVEAFSGTSSTDDLYRRIFAAAESGNQTVSGVREPLLAEAGPLILSGQIKSPEDLKQWVQDGKRLLPEPVAPLVEPVIEPDAPATFSPGVAAARAALAEAQMSGDMAMADNGETLATLALERARMRRGGRMDALSQARASAMGMISPATITGSNVQEGTEMPAEMGEASVGSPIPIPENPLIENPAAPVTVAADETLPSEAVVADAAGGLPSVGVKPDLANLLAFDDAQLKPGEAGLGRKNAPAFLLTDKKDEVYQDARAAGSDKNLTRKLGVFQRGDEVFAGSAYKNRGERISTPSGNVTYDQVLRDGWRQIAALKLTEPAKNKVVTYSATEWAGLAETLGGMSRSAQRTYSAVADALPGTVGPEAVMEPLDGNVPDEGALTDDESAQASGSTDLMPAVSGRAASRPDLVPTDAEVERLSKLTDIGGDYAGIIYDEFGGGAMATEDALDMLKSMIDDGDSRARLAVINLVDRIERNYASKNTQENLVLAASAIQSAAGEGVDRSEFTSRLVQASQGTSQGSSANTNRSAAGTSEGSGGEGVEEGADAGGEGDGVRFSGNIAREGTPASRTAYLNTVGNLRAAGYDVEFIEGSMAEMGSYERGLIRAALADAESPSAAEFTTLLHEAGHGLFEGETPERKAQLIAAIDSLTDSELGLGAGFNPRIAAGIQGTARETVRQEERLVEGIARKLMAAGFNPSESQGFAQALWRAVKDLYLRALLLLQQAMHGGNPSGDTATAYFENRLKALASGDAAYSFTSWLGGPKLNRMRQAEQHVEPMDGAGTLPAWFNPETGEMVYAEAAPDTVAGAEWNADIRYNGVSTVDDAVPVTKDLNIDNAAAGARDVAANNAREDMMRAMFDAWDSAGLNPSGMTFEQWLGTGNFLGKQDLPEEVIAAYNRRLTEAGQAPIDPRLKIAALPSGVQQQRASSIALKAGQKMWGDMVERMREAVARNKANPKKLDRMNDRLANLFADYTNADLMLNTALYGDGRQQAGVLEQLKRAVGDISKTRNAAHKAGILTQTIKNIEGDIENPPMQQYITAIQRLYERLSKDTASGAKFFDMMQAASQIETIDWEADTTAEIREKIKAEALFTPALQPLMNLDVDSKALLSVLIAFGRSNDYFMGLLYLRLAKAGAERTTVNAALKAAMKDHKDAIKETRSIVSQLPRLGARADRLIQRIGVEKDKRTDLLDEMRRDEAYEEFHKVAEPVLRETNNRLEAGIGELLTDWEAGDGAAYWVATGPNFQLTRNPKTKQIEVADGVEKKLNFQENGTTSAAVRADMAANRKWLDSVPVDQRGATWLTTDSIQRKLSLNDTQFKHEATKRDLVTDTIGDAVKRIARVGTPLALKVARRMKHQLSLYSPKVVHEAEVFGTKWAAAESAAQKKLGRIDLDTFRTVFHNGGWKFIETRADITGAGADPWAQFDKVLRELKKHFETEPATAALMAKPGAWAAMEKYFRAGAKANEFLTGFAKQTGMKVSDNGILRDPIGHPAFTVMRGFSKSLRRLHTVMAASDWLGVNLKAGNVAEEYRVDPGNLRAEMAKRFTPDVWKRFVAPLAQRGGISLFNAPPLPSGAMARAQRENVVKALETAGGDAVTFAENLYNLEGGTGDVGEFVGETLSTFQNFFDSIHGQFAHEAEAAKHGMPPVPHREMMDARVSEDYPAEWLDYYAFDAHNLTQTVRRMTYQAAFGRNMDGMREDLRAAEAEQNGLVSHYAEIVMDARKTGKTGSALKAEIKSRVKASGVEPLRLEQAAQNEQQLRVANDMFTNLVVAQAGAPMAVRAWAETVKTAAALTVQGPATAGTDTISLIEQPLRKTGYSKQTAQQIKSTAGSLGRSVAGTFLQMLGLQLHTDATWQALRHEVQGQDPDASLSAAEKWAAILNQENHLAGGWTKAMRLIRTLPNTGFSGRKGNLGFDNAKPLGAFSMFARWGNLAAAWGIYRNIESMTAAAVKHFQTPAGMVDAADPAFQFTGEMLGWNSEPAWNYYREQMAQMGMNVEQMARAALAGGPLVTPDQMRAIGTMANTEITKESSIATRPPSFVTNPMVALATPLVSWGVSKAADMAGGFRDANGALTTKSVLRGLSPYAAILPLGLAYAAMRDEFDEEVLGKKANVSGYGGSSDPWLVTLDRLGRVGTFGTFGDVANAALNRDTNRDFSVDSRVFFVSSLLSALSAAGTAWRQGQVDYANVGRPLAQAFGGSGYLQYADGLNHILGMDNAESRVVARINVNNYLRVAGRELKMDVRTSKGGKSLPTMTKPYVGQMIMAAYANDPSAFRDAYENAKAAAREEKHADPEQFVQRSYLAYHPLNAVFTTKRTDEEYARLLRQMGDEGKRAVSEAIHLFNRYAEQIYVKPPKLAKSEREVPAAAYFSPPSRLREARAAAGY